jgi:hypothetical protein
LRNLKNGASSGQACSRGGLIGMLPVEHNDPINAKILAVSEDKIEGFVREPFEEIANRSGAVVEDVMARIAAMLRAGTIRRVRQTLLATNLAEGALVAWKVSEDKIDAAFDWMFERDPLDRHRQRRIGLQTLDHSQGSSGILAASALRIAGEKSWRGAFSSNAGKRHFYTRRWTCSPENN